MLVTTKANYGNYIHRTGELRSGSGVEWIIGVTPDSTTKDGTAYYGTIIQTVGYGSYGLGTSWTEPGV